MKNALETSDGRAQLRRLEMVLQLPAAKDDEALSGVLARAEREAATLSRRLLAEEAAVEELTAKGGRGAADGAAEKGLASEKATDNEPGYSYMGAQENETEEQRQRREEAEAAALRIQSRYRGGQARATVKQHKEEVAAATKIQALHRGNLARAEILQRLAEDAGGLPEDEGGAGEADA